MGLKPVRKGKQIAANFVLKIVDDDVPLSANYDAVQPQVASLRARRNAVIRCVMPPWGS